MRAFALLLLLSAYAAASSPMDSDRFFTFDDSTQKKPTVADEKTFFAPSGYAEVDSLLKNFDHPSSPLDSPSAKNKALEDRSLSDNLEQLSPCQKDCSKGLMDAFGLILKSMTHVERYNQICMHYNESYACIKEEEKCGNEDHTMFETITSGIKYMCVDQLLAFQSTIECIDTQAQVVQNECESECNTKSVVMNWIMRSSIARQIQGGLTNGFAGMDSPLGGVNLDEMSQPAGLDPEMLNEFRDMSAQMCRVGDCVLLCLKHKFDTRCEGSAGTLLSEVFVRPIAASQEKMTMISPIMGMFVPQPCSFLHNGAELAKHRIDPLMDGELRRMYAEKELERAQNFTDDTTTNAPVKGMQGSFSFPKTNFADGTTVPAPMQNSFPSPRMRSPLDSVESFNPQVKANDRASMDLLDFADVTNNTAIEGSGEDVEGSGAEASGFEDNLWIIKASDRVKDHSPSKIWRRVVYPNETITIMSKVTGTLTCRFVHV